MSRSVRLRLVHWLKGVFDYASEQAVHVLCGGQVHTQTACDLNKMVVAGVEDHASEGHVNHAHVVSGFHQNIDKMNRTAIVADFSELVAQGNHAPAFNHDFIAHQRALHIRNLDVASLNARQSGVHPLHAQAETLSGETQAVLRREERAAPVQQSAAAPKPNAAGRRPSVLPDPPGRAEGRSQLLTTLAAVALMLAVVALTGA